MPAIRAWPAAAWAMCSTGVIAGLLAQGLPLFEAAQAGVLAHALAGDAAARDGRTRPAGQ